MYKDTDKTW